MEDQKCIHVWEEVGPLGEEIENIDSWIAVQCIVCSFHGVKVGNKVLTSAKEILEANLAAIAALEERG